MSLAYNTGVAYLGIIDVTSKSLDENHVVSDNNCINVNFTTSEFFKKGCKMIIRLHIVLVTLHVWFTISMRNTNRIGDTKYRF